MRLDTPWQHRFRHCMHLETRVASEPTHLPQRRFAIAVPILRISPHTVPTAPVGILPFRLGR